MPSRTLIDTEQKRHPHSKDPCHEWRSVKDSLGAGQACGKLATIWRATGTVISARQTSGTTALTCRKGYDAGSRKRPVLV